MLRRLCVCAAVTPHAHSGCPAVAYPSDMVDLFAPFLALGQAERPEVGVHKTPIYIYITKRFVTRYYLCEKRSFAKTGSRQSKQTTQTREAPGFRRAQRSRSRFGSNLTRQQTTHHHQLQHILQSRSSSASRCQIRAANWRCGKRHLFLSFPYICPEPVLAK